VTADAVAVAPQTLAEEPELGRVVGQRRLCSSILHTTCHAGSEQSSSSLMKPAAALERLRVREVGGEWEAITGDIRSAEAPDRLALHPGRIVKRALHGVDDRQRAAVGIALARTLIQQLDEAVSGADVSFEAPIEPGSVLSGKRRSFTKRLWASGNLQVIAPASESGGR